jgi:hypothetical protein
VQSNDFRPILDVLRGTCILPETVPPPLYHYTDIDGLMGIFNTGELWATDVHFMNDTSEYDHANEMIAAELRSIGADVLPLSEPPLPSPSQEGVIELGGEWATRVGMTGVAKRFLETTQQDLLKPIFRTYVSCFCDSGNLLRQWRAYASGGYSIEFDGSLLGSRYQGSDPRAILTRVEYSEDKQKELIRSLLRTHFPPFLSTALTGVDESAIHLRLIGEFALLVARACLKSAAFDDEREWRIIRFGLLEDSTERFRASKGLPLPYRPIEIKSPEVPITGIMVGHRPAPLGWMGSISETRSNNLLRRRRAWPNRPS